MAQLLAGIFKLESEKRKFRKECLDTSEEHKQESHMILFAVRAPHLYLMRPVIDRPLDCVVNLA
jgi:hypothetical protein